VTTAAPRFALAAVAGLAGVASMVAGVEVAGAQTQPNACELLTQNDAKKILGKTVRRETNLAGTQASSCSYVAAKDATRVIGIGVERSHRRTRPPTHTRELAPPRSSTA
jgi:hypothetical protein